jgi:Ca2+-binding RTX toxin-like protein
MTLIATRRFAMTMSQPHLDTVSGMKTFLTLDFPNFLMFDLKGTSDDDTLTTPAPSDYLVSAGAGDDLIFIANHGDTGLNGVLAGDGQDRVYGASTDDYVLAGRGADHVSADRGEDRVFGQGGDDTMIGGNGDDRLAGGTGDDKLLGNSGNDTLLGGGGSDMLKGGTGTNHLHGGNGNDLYILFGDDTAIDVGGDDSYAISLGAHVTISDTDGLDTLEIGQQIETLTFERRGNDLLISGLKGGGSVDVDQFFVAGHELDFLVTSETFYQLHDIHDLKAGESVNGGDVWGFVS